MEDSNHLVEEDTLLEGTELEAELGNQERAGIQFQVLPDNLFQGQLGIRELVHLGNHQEPVHLDNHLKQGVLSSLDKQEPLHRLVLLQEVRLDRPRRQEEQQVDSLQLRRREEQQLDILEEELHMPVRLLLLLKYLLRGPCM